MRRKRSRAYVTVKEPGTGNSALHYAFKGDSVDIAKLLLSYGSNPDAEDKKGVQARKLATSKGMKQLLATFDQKGALAFEDAPGTWVKSVSESGAKFWYNRATKEARWNKPPSAAWQRLLHQGHPTSYYNEVTGQRSTQETPAELPDDMVTEMTVQLRRSVAEGSFTRGEFSIVSSSLDLVRALQPCYSF
eukprot:gene22745-29910_t